MTKSLHALLRSAGLVVPAGLANPDIRSISCDSRSITEGTLFLGVPGESVDGGVFWADALYAGAAAAVIGSKAIRNNLPGPNDVVVIAPDPVEHWVGELASVFWGSPSSSLTLIGVTGTNGKTTTSHLIEHLSGALGKSTALFGTLVNRWPNQSVVATHTTEFADKLQRQLAEAVQAGVQLAAMEVSSHALAQKRVAGCRFSGAIFTNLTQDHLDYHNSMESYFEAKANLFATPLLQAGQNRAVVNIDNPWGAFLAGRLGERCWRSSLVEGEVERSLAELTITDLRIKDEGVIGRLISPLGEGEFQSPLIGSFNLMNLLQAVGALLQQGFSLPPLLEAISEFRGVPGRMERVELSDIETSELPTVLVDYAHTPDGLRNALIASRAFTDGQLVCVFGCGGDRDRGKRPQMGAIAAEFADRIVVTSDNPRTEDPKKIVADILTGIPSKTLMNIEEDRASAIEMAISQSKPGDVILLAGKGHEDYQIIGLQKIHFDDRKEAIKALRSRNNS